MAKSSNLLKQKPMLKRTGVINIRAKICDRALIDQAAESEGKTRSDFMLEAARREAINTILNKTLFQVDPGSTRNLSLCLMLPQGVMQSCVN
jgi:uncharacterized protein (DUF1778 family)